MSDWQSDDRELWRAAQYSHIYGQQAAQDYLAWVSSGHVIVGALVVAAIVYVLSPLVFFSGAILLLIGGIVFTLMRRENLRKGAVRQYEATVQRLKTELQGALTSQNGAAVGEACKRLKTQEAFGTAAPILKIALADSDPYLRLSAIRGLRWGCDHWPHYSHTSDLVLDEVPYTMLSSVLSDESEYVDLRVAAAEGIGDGNLIYGYQALKENIMDVSPEVRVACCHALGRLAAQNRHLNDSHMSSRPNWRGFVRPDSLPLLLEALRDHDGRVRQEAAQALGEYRDASALRPLQEVASDQTEPAAVRGAALDSVTAIKQSATA